MLDRDECLRLLGDVQVGRVAVTTEALPVVLPVNFLLDGDRVVFSSAPGTKLYVAATGARMAFEAEDVDPLPALAGACASPDPARWSRTPTRWSASAVSRSRRGRRRARSRSS
jgi:nitroimidazol reductase NimA-like FMN-containing flavoprotein (pyridoxamine 5'-phosphate oxidase superfamily)